MSKESFAMSVEMTETQKNLLVYIENNLRNRKGKSIDQMMKNFYDSFVEKSCHKNIAANMGFMLTNPPRILVREKPKK